MPQLGKKQGNCPLHEGFPMPAIKVHFKYKFLHLAMVLMFQSLLARLMCRQKNRRARLPGPHTSSRLGPQGKKTT
jgi:hypothetical protein